MLGAVLSLSGGGGRSYLGRLKKDRKAPSQPRVNLPQQH